jgi:hypothetical protein
MELNMGVWQGVAMDSLKFTWARLALPIYTLRVGHPINGLTAVSGVACSQGGLRASSTPLDTTRRTPMKLTKPLMVKNDDHITMALNVFILERKNW